MQANKNGHIILLGTDVHVAARHCILQLNPTVAVQRLQMQPFATILRGKMDLNIWLPVGHCLVTRPLALHPPARCAPPPGPDLQSTMLAVHSRRATTPWIGAAVLAKCVCAN